MKHSVKKITISLALLQLLILSNIASVEGEYTIVSSRVSLISDISINSYPNLLKPNTTQFSLNATVEILNRDDQNQTLIESSTSPYVFLNVSFVNQSLELTVRSIGSGSVETCSYPPGITVEVHPMIFYVNQTDLPYLPDGNYTFWRPIYIETLFYNTTLGDAYEAILQMSSGVMNITYIPFDYIIPEYKPLSIVLPLTSIIVALLMICKCKKKKSDY